MSRLMAWVFGCAVQGFLFSGCVGSPSPQAVEQWTLQGPVAGINTESVESAPHIRDDGLELFFVRGTAGSEDIYVATRSSKTSPWTAPVEVAALNSEALDQNPTLSADGTVMYISSRRSNVPGPWWIYESSRVDIATQ